MKGKSVAKPRENTLSKAPKFADSVVGLNAFEQAEWKKWERLKKMDLEEVRMASEGILDRVRQAMLDKHQADRVDVELQVTDVRHARSAEVLSFCLAHLGSGGTWGALRHKLGLGPGDIRWRLIRERAVEGLLPTNEEEALKAVGSQRSFLVNKLEGMLEELEERINMIGDGKRTHDHHFWKLRMEGMNLLLEENSKQLTDHLEIKRAKLSEKANTGVSIIVQNQYYIPRPGDPRDRITDVVPLINEIVEMNEELDGDHKELQANPESVKIPLLDR